MKKRIYEVVVLAIAACASIAPARLVWAACNKDCKFISTHCIKGSPNAPTTGREFTEPQGGYWYSTAEDRKQRCKLEPEIEYRDYEGCTPVCVGNIHNSIGSVSGTFSDLKKRQRYGCRNSGPTCDAQ